jgi:hypothetical protein
MSLDQLKTCTKKRLEQMARASGVAGWHAMDKSQLVRAIAAKRNGARRNGKARNHKPSARRTRVAAIRNGARPKVSAYTNGHARRLYPEASHKHLGARGPQQVNGHTRDRIVLVVRDSYWLQAYWQISLAAVQRAEASLREEWHGAVPVLRVHDVTSEDSSSNAERHVRDIEIHGAVNNWYIDVPNPPRSYRVDIGYLSRRGKFFSLAHSNVVGTPVPGVTEGVDEKWASVQEQFEKIYARSRSDDEEAGTRHLKRILESRANDPLGAGLPGFGLGAMAHLRKRKFWFDLDAELIVHGSTQPGARVSMMAEKVQLRPDGTFTMRFRLPDKRLIIPASAASADGGEERTIVLAVERNTKELEPMLHESNSSEQP